MFLHMPCFFFFLNLSLIPQCLVKTFQIFQTFHQTRAGNTARCLLSMPLLAYKYITTNNLNSMLL